MSALGLGAWDPVLRDLADHDYERAQRIARWPVVEVLHAYMAMMRGHAAESYRHAMLVWAAVARPKKNGKLPDPPKRPAILDE